MLNDTEKYWKDMIERKDFNVFYINLIESPININIHGFNKWKVHASKEDDKSRFK